MFCPDSGYSIRGRVTPSEKRITAVEIASHYICPNLPAKEQVSDRWMPDFGQIILEGRFSMSASNFRILETQPTEFYDCEIKLSTSRLEAQQLKDFADAQMPRTGVGEVPWSTPLSSAQLSSLAEQGEAEFVTARMMLAADAEPPLIGVGVLIRSPNIYANPRIILVVDGESRGLGIGKRIANELLNLLQPGETVEAEVQLGRSQKRRTARFFEELGFRCVDENYRSGEVPEYVNGLPTGKVQRGFALYAYTSVGEV